MQLLSRPLAPPGCSPHLLLKNGGGLHDRGSSSFGVTPSPNLPGLKCAQPLKNSSGLCGMARRGGARRSARRSTLAHITSIQSIRMRGQPGPLPFSSTRTQTHAPRGRPPAARAPHASQRAQRAARANAPRRPREVPSSQSSVPDAKVHTPPTTRGNPPSLFAFTASHVPRRAAPMVRPPTPSKRKECAGNATYQITMAGAYHSAGGTPVSAPAAVHECSARLLSVPLAPRVMLYARSTPITQIPLRSNTCGQTRDVPPLRLLPCPFFCLPGSASLPPPWQPLMTA